MTRIEATISDIRDRLLGRPNWWVTAVIAAMGAVIGGMAAILFLVFRMPEVSKIVAG